MITNEKVTYSPCLTWTRYNMSFVNLQDVLNVIKSGNLNLYRNDVGNYSLIQITGHIRGIHNNPEEQNYCKREYLPIIFFNGEFSSVTSNSYDMVSYSNMTALDFDNIQNQQQSDSVKAMLCANPYVVAVFRTLKPYRLKALVMHDNNDPSRHKEMYGQLTDQFDKTLLDLSCCDLTRRNFLCYDPDIWVNPNPIPFHFVPQIVSMMNPQPQSVQATSTYNGSGTGKKRSKKSIVAIMNKSWHMKHPDYWKQGNRANSIFKCSCLFCKWGVEKDIAEEYFKREWISTGMDVGEIVKNVNGGYNAEWKNFDTVPFKIYN